MKKILAVLAFGLAALAGPAAGDTVTSYPALGIGVGDSPYWTGTHNFLGVANFTGPVAIYQTTTHSGTTWIKVDYPGYGAITTGAGSVIFSPASSVVDFNNAGNTVTGFAVDVGNSRIGLAAGQKLGWTANTASGDAAIDTGFGRGGTTGAIRVNPGLGTVPTISSGFGTGPSVTAGGSNSLFQVNVGTGGTATSGVIAFNGTWTAAPYCHVNDEGTSAGKSKAVATTTQVTLTTTTAWSASSLLDVFCVSP